MGIEPTALAWEARVLPLYDARCAIDSSRVPAGRQFVGRCGGDIAPPLTHWLGSTPEIHLA